MSIYCPLSEALGIEPNPNFKFDWLVLPENFDPDISRQEAIKRNSEFITCDRCGVIGNRPNMMRWHFENCKTQLRDCRHCLKIIPRQGVKDYLYKQKIYCDRNCYSLSKIGKEPIVMTDEVKAKISIKAKEQSSERSMRAKTNEIWKKSGRWKK
jgi:hypothetical protein